MSELLTVLYIYSPKISDTYEHSIHDHRFHLQFSDHRIFESKPHKYQVHYISQSKKDTVIESTDVTCNCLSLNIPIKNV